MPTSTAAASIENRWPFRRSADHLTTATVTVRGAMPSWLAGDLVRTCPAVFERGAWRVEHWFDALAMLYAFRVELGGTVHFRKSLVECEAARDAAAGRAQLAGFGTATRRSLFERLRHPVPHRTDNPNVNIGPMGPDLVAMTETERQLIIDGATLRSRGEVSYRDPLGRAFMTAHPELDVARGLVVNVASVLGLVSTFSIYEHAPDARVRRVVGSWKTRRIPYVHSFGLTPQHAILVGHPYTANPLRMICSNVPFSEHFRFRPEEGTRIVLVDRSTGAVREHMTGPFFVFHTINAFEMAGETVLDLLAYPDASVIAQGRIDALGGGWPELRPMPRRIRCVRGVEYARAEPLADTGFEFPAVNHHLVKGRPYRFAYGAASWPDPEARPDGNVSEIVKLDITRGVIARFAESDHLFGEPVFVARPGGTSEDDGVLLAVGTRRSVESTAMVVLDATSLSPIAWAEIPMAIPLGFHGSFISAPLPSRVVGAKGM